MHGLDSCARVCVCVRMCVIIWLLIVSSPMTLYKYRDIINSHGPFTQTRILLEEMISLKRDKLGNNISLSLSRSLSLFRCSISDKCSLFSGSRYNVTRCNFTRCNVTRCNGTRCNVTRCNGTRCNVTRLSKNTVKNRALSLHVRGLKHAWRLSVANFTINHA